MTLYPLKFYKEFIERPWGGEELIRPYLRTAQHSSVKIGEAYLLSALPEYASRVENGFLEGNDFEEISEIYLWDLIGDPLYQQYGTRFPLLAKLVDACTATPVHVHPNDDTAFERHDTFGKDEFWYVVSAADRASVFVGLRPEVTETQFREAAASGSVRELLNEVPVKKGDAFYIPAGMVHALGAGVELFVLHQTSDVNYPLEEEEAQEYGYQTEDFSDLAIDAVDFSARTTGRIQLLGTQNFGNGIVLSQHSIKEGDVRTVKQQERFSLLFVAEGKISVLHENIAVAVSAGEIVFLPAALEESPVVGQGVFFECTIK